MATKSINLNDILSTTTNFVENGERAQSIYVNDIFFINGCEMSFKQKRDVRRKLRRKLEDIITSWNISTKTKKVEKLPEIYKAWEQLKIVYKNENIIYSGYKKEYADMCKAFLNAYQSFCNAKSKSKSTESKSKSTEQKKSTESKSKSTEQKKSTESKSKPTESKSKPTEQKKSVQPVETKNKSEQK